MQYLDMKHKNTLCVNIVSGCGKENRLKEETLADKDAPCGCKTRCQLLLQDKYILLRTISGARRGVVVKTLRYKPAGSIPNGVIGIFQWHNPSGRTMVLGSTQPLNRNEYQVYFPGVKATDT